jgi:Fur family transcriptional regulator, ferric uptake regulator
MSKQQPGETDVARMFRGTPFRLTEQRRLIVQKLAGMKKYATAKQLHARLAKSHPRIGLATVYRTLETLRGLGVVATLAQAHGETAYLHCRSGHHHHAVCTRCGRVDDVPCRALTTYERILSRGLRFQLTEHQLEFYGVCARCS